MRILFGLALLMVASCSHRPEVAPGPDGAQADTTTAAGTTEPADLALIVVERPLYDPASPPPCESHTACYLAAKAAHATGRRAGYLIALKNCEYYRGAFQLEKFYGMCLVILGDAYRQLNNFSESINAYQRLLDTGGDDDQALTLEAQAAIEEVTLGAAKPDLYRRYLDAAALLARFNTDGDRKLLPKVEVILAALHRDAPDWALDETVVYLRDQVAAMLAGPDTTDAASDAGGA